MEFCPAFGSLGIYAETGRAYQIVKKNTNWITILIFKLSILIKGKTVYFVMVCLYIHIMNLTFS
jgi:hypothetical protein